MCRDGSCSDTKPWGWNDRDREPRGGARRSGLRSGRVFLDAWWAMRWGADFFKPPGSRARDARRMRGNFRERRNRCRVIPKTAGETFRDCCYDSRRNIWISVLRRAKEAEPRRERAFARGLVLIGRYTRYTFARSRKRICGCAAEQELWRGEIIRTRFRPALAAVFFDVQLRAPKKKRFETPSDGLINC